ncbi:signal peptidase complex subunit 1-like [Rhopilema esculentum]|uniref:signal peptidase complex subunit 1-like n=1 Tax=Rhopilema esculentum TaxID=499914 RepID=UPI0031DF0724
MDILDKAEDALKNALLSIPFIKRSVDYVQSIPTHMDFEGQKKAEKLYQVIIALFAIVGFIYGFLVEQFSQTVLFVFIGAGISSLLVLPPWPWFRRSPLTWQKPEKKKTEEKPKQQKVKEYKAKKNQ